LRKAISIALLAVFSLPLISQLASATPESKLPPCCRRDGKHHCSMSMSGSTPATDNNAATVKPANVQCASFPTANSCPPVSVFLVAPVPASAQFAAAQLDAVAQTEARYRIAYSRTRQKRGPPSSHS